MKIKKVNISNYKVFRNFEIDFTEDGEPLPLVVIAGANGSGKSTLFNAMHERAADPSFLAAMTMEFTDESRGEVVYYPVFDVQIENTEKLIFW